MRSSGNPGLTVESIRNTVSPGNFLTLIRTVTLEPAT